MSRGVVRAPRAPLCGLFTTSSSSRTLQPTPFLDLVSAFMSMAGVPLGHRWCPPVVVWGPSFVLSVTVLLSSTPVCEWVAVAASCCELDLNPFTSRSSPAWFVSLSLSPSRGAGWTHSYAEDLVWIHCLLFYTLVHDFSPFSMSASAIYVSVCIRNACVYACVCAHVCDLCPHALLFAISFSSQLPWLQGKA